MKKNLLRFFSVGLIAVLFSAGAFAQNERQTINAASNLYVVSAEAGVVNFVEGKVSVVRKNAKSGALLNGDELEIGDVVSTGADGKAEILLNPGSFVRLAGDSTFEFTTTSLEDLQLKLTKGSAMFEVITDNEFTFAVNTPKAVFNVVKSGIYRVNVLADGAGVIEIWSGKAVANGMPVKGGKQATVSGAQTSIAKFERGDKDALELWSKARAKQLARVNARLQNSQLRTSLMNSFYRNGWSLNDSYGLWVYSRLHGSYCFMPFGYGWSSPYGYYYKRDIWHYNLPPVIYNPLPTTTTTTTTTGGSLGSAGTGIKGNSPGGSGARAEGTTRTLPPYQRVQRDIGQYPSEVQADGLSMPNLSPARRTSSSSSPASAPSSAPSASGSGLTSTDAPPSKKGNQ